VVVPPRSEPGFAAAVKTVSLAGGLRWAPALTLAAGTTMYDVERLDAAGTYGGISMIRSNVARAVFLAALLILPVLAIAACNTIEGAGQDIKSTGAWIEKKAGDKK
jgi:predicted small secreted protein